MHTAKISTSFQKIRALHPQVGASAVQTKVVQVLSVIAPKLVVKSLKGNLEGDTDPFMYRGGVDSRGGNLINYSNENTSSFWARVDARVPS